MTCRVCGSGDASVLPIGRYADFFLLRVDTKKDSFQLYSRSQAIRIDPTLSYALPVRALRKARRILFPSKSRPTAPFRTQMQACESCHAITPCHEYSLQDLLGFYRDYRSETYNRDRISVEPDYARIAKNVGSDPLEVRNRNAAVDRFLSKNARHFAGRAMIDYGGSDGRFIPSFAYGQFESIDIYDVSGTPLHSSVDVRKVKKVAEPRLETYSFLTCMHVLEHVGNPRALVAEAMRLLAPGGLLYIEVPLELTQSMREDFAQRIIDVPIIIHEHLNKFDGTSIRRLVQSTAGLELVDDAEDVVELGWISGLVGRFLARKA
jgi:SAM-dependent methyltransferase